MCEGASTISGPIPPDPTLFPGYYRRPASARARLEGADVQLDFLSGPLAPDPTLYPTCYSARPASLVPRARPNARAIMERGRSGTVGVLLRLEGISLHTASPPPKKLKDHGKENVQRLREIQKRCREKEMEKVQGAPKPVKALWKSSKYQQVESKVRARLQEQPPPPEPAQAAFLRSHTRCGSGLAPPRRPPSPRPSRPPSPGLGRPPSPGPGRPPSPGPSRPPSPGPSRPPSPGPSRPTTPGDEMQVRGSSIDFVAHNARNAKNIPMRRSRSLQNLSEVLQEKQRQQKEYDSKQKGQVPQYLLDLKDKWMKEQEELKKQTPDPSLPPGHTKMPERERQETLQKIQETQAQLLKELVMLPVRADNLGIQNRRTGLEKKLSEIEEAIKVFSRPKVFIKIDS